MCKSYIRVEYDIFLHSMCKIKFDTYYIKKKLLQSSASNSFFCRFYNQGLSVYHCVSFVLYVELAGVILLFLLVVAASAYASLSSVICASSVADCALKCPIVVPRLRSQALCIRKPFFFLCPFINLSFTSPLSSSTLRAQRAPS